MKGEDDFEIPRAIQELFNPKIVPKKAKNTATKAKPIISKRRAGEREQDYLERLEREGKHIEREIDLKLAKVQSSSKKEQSTEDMIRETEEEHARRKAKLTGKPLKPGRKGEDEDETSKGKETKKKKRAAQKTVSEDEDEEEEEDAPVRDFSDFKDEVSFGEVVAAPPTLTVVPKRRLTDPRVYNPGHTEEDASHDKRRRKVIVPESIRQMVEGTPSERDKARRETERLGAISLERLRAKAIENYKAAKKARRDAGGEQSYL
eukprot:TRINITY_DN2940_c0_g1_i1.p1 TRINITY_DN2940_c0_g1~~TRINITY_DN2940_c0_g1_i1.p1  ORF type:complete len:262 (-),score=76.81 TRINITY_DN2940_c0_g1_i1:121-906(-)